MEALKVIQKRFYTDFPPHEKEKVYKFATPSTMKPTKWSCKANLNLFSILFFLSKQSCSAIAYPHS